MGERLDIAVVVDSAKVGIRVLPAVVRKGGPGWVECLGEGVHCSREVVGEGADPAPLVLTQRPATVALVDRDPGHQARMVVVPGDDFGPFLNAASYGLRREPICVRHLPPA